MPTINTRRSHTYTYRQVVALARSQVNVHGPDALLGHELDVIAGLGALLLVAVHLQHLRVRQAVCVHTKKVKKEGRRRGKEGDEEGMKKWNGSLEGQVLCTLVLSESCKDCG